MGIQGRLKGFGHFITTAPVLLATEANNLNIEIPKAKKNKKKTD
jgi:hypothetical protein